MNRMFNIKSSHDFCRHRNSIQVIYFQINVADAYIVEVESTREMQDGGTRGQKTIDFIMKLVFFFANFPVSLFRSSTDQVLW